MQHSQIPKRKEGQVESNLQRVRSSYMHCEKVSVARKDCTWPQKTPLIKNVNKQNVQEHPTLAANVKLS